MENMNFTPELISKAKTAKSAEELIKIAEGEGVALDEKDAALFFNKLNQPEELADEELDAVAGGGCGEKKPSYPLHDWDWSCEHQQDYAWDSMWQGECLMCVYAGEENDATETIRCHYPNKVR